MDKKSLERGIEIQKQLNELKDMVECTRTESDPIPSEYSGVNLVICFEYRKGSSKYSRPLRENYKEKVYLYIRALLVQEIEELEKEFAEL